MPKLTGIWDVHNGYLADKREAGATLEEIGKEVGVSRERVRQVLIEHYGTTRMTLLLTSGQLGRLVSLSRETITGYRKRGIIKPANNNLEYPLYGTDAIATILTLRRCKICGKTLPFKRLRYCSPECYKIGNNKARQRCQWRKLHRKTGQPITASTAYEKKGYA